MAVTPARIQMLRRLRPELADMPDAQIADMFGGGEPSTAQIDMGQLIPQAQTVTPAAPAPMQPTQLQAPEPTQQQLAPQAQGEMAKAMALQAAQQDMINQQIAANQARIQQAESGAEVPPEVQQILAQREARYAEEEAQLAEDRKGAVWDAIAKAGFKMAQSQSPYFASALAEGMQAGLEGYDAAKAKSAEKKARLQEQKESVVLDRYDALTKARAAAREQLMSGVKLTADTAALANATNENLLNLATTESKIRTSKAQAQVAETTAQYAPEMARANLAEIYARTAASNRSGYGRGGGGDGRELTPNAIFTETNQLTDKIDAVNAELAGLHAELPRTKTGNFFTGTPEYAAYRAKLAQRDNLIRRRHQIQQMGGQGSTAVPAQGKIRVLGYQQ